mgnify:CR=1 FL=1
MSSVHSSSSRIFQLGFPSENPVADFELKWEKCGDDVSASVKLIHNQIIVMV